MKPSPKRYHECYCGIFFIRKWCRISISIRFIFSFIVVW